MGSSPTPRTRNEPPAYCVWGVEYEEFLRGKTTKKGYPLGDSTIRIKLTIIKTLQKSSNLWDIEEVEKFIDNSD